MRWRYWRPTPLTQRDPCLPCQDAAQIQVQGGMQAERGFKRRGRRQTKISPSSVFKRERKEGRLE